MTSAKFKKITNIYCFTIIQLMKYSSIVTTISTIIFYITNVHFDLQGKGYLNVIK